MRQSSLHTERCYIITGQPHDGSDTAHQASTNQQLEMQYNAALKARGSLSIWLDKNMSWFAAAGDKRGRSLHFSDVAVRFCLTINCLFGLTLRQSTGFVQSLQALFVLPCPVRDLSALVAASAVCMSKWHTSPVQMAYICWLSRRASCSWAKKSGNAKYLRS